jgi:hypothetical protein
MMFVIHRWISLALILLCLPCFRNCLSVEAIPSHMSSTLSVLIRQDGLDAI